jgi:hypothetical protein
MSRRYRITVECIQNVHGAHEITLLLVPTYASLRRVFVRNLNPLQTRASHHYRRWLVKELSSHWKLLSKPQLADSRSEPDSSAKNVFYKESSMIK